MELTKLPETGTNIYDAWLEYLPDIRNFVFKRTDRDYDLTNDLLQEILIKAYKFLDGGKAGIKNYRAWFFTIAKNAVYDHQRKQSHITYSIPETCLNDETDLYKQAADFILPMLSFLPEKYALPLKLSDIDNINQQEIAERLRLSLPATKSRIQRARLLLKDEFFTCFDLSTSKNGNLIDLKLKPQCRPLQSVQLAHKIL